MARRSSVSSLGLECPFSYRPSGGDSVQLVRIVEPLVRFANGAVDLDCQVQWRTESVVAQVREQLPALNQARVEPATILGIKPGRLCSDVLRL